MDRSMILKIVTVIAVLVTLAFEFFAVGLLISGISDIEGPTELAWVSVIVVSPLVVLSGLFLSRRSPLLGGVLVVSAAVPMGVLWFWFPPFWAAGIAVAAIGAFRARRIAGESRAMA